MKLTKDRLKNIIKEELEEILGFGSKPIAQKNQQVIKAVDLVQRGLDGLPDIFMLGVAGDSFGYLEDDAYKMFAQFAKQKGLPTLLNKIANLYEPLEILRKAILASKDEKAIERFNDKNKGIYGRLWPLVMFLKTTDGEQLKGINNLSQLEKADDAGVIKNMPGFLSLIASEANIKENTPTPVQERKKR